MARPQVDMRNSSVRKDANCAVSEKITSQFIHLVQGLPSNEKTDHLKDQFLMKFVSTETDSPQLRRSRAIEKWLATEKRNEETNERLLTTCEDFQILPHVKYSRFISWCRDVVRNLLGDLPPEEALIGSFSGGASTSRKRTQSQPARKYLGQADITPAARDWFDLTIEQTPGWNSDFIGPVKDPFQKGLHIRNVTGNIMFTVLKNTTIDRCACKEPDINMFLQKGLGRYIRTRLRTVGIDLNDQSRNRDLARLGSFGSLATLDLSSASDSVTTMLVETLLPDLWYSCLNSLRCERTVIDGEEHVNEMFSSMGNGFTFELESLLFWVLSKATCYFRGISGVISVYGDDIIVPVDAAHDLIWVLSYFGFSVNPEKSFVDGTFRESCGGHYISGRDVTPFYLRKPILRLTDLIHTANAVRRWSITDLGVCDPEAYPLWVWLRDQIPQKFWGGRELSSIYQLVTPDGPRFKLEPHVQKRKTGTGGYIHWLNSTWHRTDPSEVSTSEESSTGTLCRVRRATQRADTHGPTRSGALSSKGKLGRSQCTWTVPSVVDLFVEEVIPEWKPHCG